MTSIRTLTAGALALALAFAPAFAATPPAAAPGSLQPTDTKAYADWTVRCYPVQSPSPCDMFQVLAQKQTGQRVMSISLAYMPSQDKHVIQIAVPLGVAIQKGLVIESPAYTSPTLSYRRCDRAGCYVEMFLPNEAVNALAGGSGGGKMKIAVMNGKTFEIAFSLNGFADAHGAMQDLARKKVAAGGGAKPGTAPAAPAATPAAPAATPAAPDNTPATSP